MSNDNFIELVKTILAYYVMSDNKVRDIDFHTFKAYHSSGIVDEKDWEIVEFKLKDFSGTYKRDKDGYFGGYSENSFLNDPFHSVKDGSAIIHSVLRKSDGVVISVGMDTQYGNIDKFYIVGSEMSVHFTNKNGATLASIQPIPQRTKLFTTLDGKDIFEGDKYWVVSSWNWIFAEALPASHGESNEYLKTFSTEEKAKEYIIPNKPCLSVNDVKIISKLYGLDEEIRYILKELMHLAKSKLSLTTNK